MVSHDPKLPKPTNVPPPTPTPAEPLAPRPPADIPKWILGVMPKLDLVIEDILCPGAAQFLAAIEPATLLRNAVAGVLLELYDERTVPSHVKNIRVIIKEMEGVAGTRQVDIFILEPIRIKLIVCHVISGSHSHKTIECNAKYIEKLGARTREEIMGVIRHEVVHCFQYNGQGTAPGGLIEGVADFVRLRAGLSPPHWRRDTGGRWDAGYEKTGFFLDWLEVTKGAGTVRRINLALRDTKYHEEAFWKGVLGERVTELWEQYTRS
ncbi:hypothetical protein FRC08_012215 [Ceratobasidium sp. 394]|nr:hypothetical protein FRC08_012215 [Ceratobasidium sp. 394]